MWLKCIDLSFPSSFTFSILKEVGTNEEFVIVISLESVLPISKDLKSMLSWLKVMKGYFPIALTFNVRLSS